MARKNLTAAYVRSIFTYDPKEGLLRWRNAAGRFGRISAGSVAGTLNGDGYRYVTVRGVSYRGVWLIWVFMKGRWPKRQVDHEDTNPGNDRWENLREANGSQNKANCRKYRKKDGKPDDLPKGVQAVQKRRSIRYRAIATKDGVREHLGYFDTPVLAHEAYLKRSRELHGEFARAD